MILKLLTKRKVQRPPAAIPAGRRVYAVGDIHGRLDLLEALLTQIDRDDRERGTAASSIIFLGDLIDRGPQSAQVVEKLLRLAAQRAQGTTRFLLGNHEEVLLSAIGGDKRALRFFTRIGGRETILSYGIDQAEYNQLDYGALLDRFRASIPEAHLAFISRFEDMIIEGDYVFVHAGIRPEVPLSSQRHSDLRWIREEFLNSNAAHEKIVVHGHTISAEAELLPHRIGLDTGAYASGRLTAMGFEGDRRWILQATD